MSETTSVRRQARAQAQQALAGSTAHVGEGEAEPVRKQQKKRRRPHRLLVCAVVGVTLLLCMAASAHVRARSMHRVTGVGSRASLLRRDDGNSSDSDQPVEHGAGSLLRIPYDELYNKCPPALKPLFIGMLVIIILFLFCSISITASDFFCPNLATLAAYLGLSETTAGVTLLAFGNGSPDVFSTFVSVRQGTFGLAVGELIGAASFITSIVVGSIAIIKPFHVPKAAFLRDVTFFTLAVLLLMRVLSDGHLTLRESSSMILLYVLYVAVVVAGSWWARRRRRRAAYADLGWKAALDDDAGSTHSADVEFPGPSESLTLTPSGTYPRRVSLSRAPPDDLLTEEREADTQRATWSLLGAVEFRDAVNALKREGTPASSHLGSRPASPVADHDEHHGNHGHQGHHHGHHHHGSGSPFGVRRNGSLRRSTRSRSSSVVAGWIARSRHQSHTDLTTDALHPQSQSPFASPTLETVPDSPAMFDTPPVPPTQPEHPALDNEVDPLDTEVLEHPLASLAPRLSALRHDDDEPLSPAESHGVPRITIVDPHGSRASPPLMLRRTDTQVSIADRVNHTFHRAVHTLFPSLQGFTNKSIVGMVLAVLSTPALLILTLTLPVVDDGRAGDEGEIALPGEEDEELGLNGNANGLTEEPEPRDRLVAGDLSDDMHNLVEGGVYRRQHMPDSSAIVRSGVSCAASEDGEDEEECVLEFSPILASLQCFFGPVVCAWLLFQDEDHVFWILLVASLAGAGAGAVVYSLAEDGTAHPWRLVRCCAGFVCSMVWIASIADEVVAVLQTFGEISGLSDAIIGLTIFAVGNSIADLVANATIAQFAPNMAYAACFGGPMLNLLLGIGGSGSYSILMSPTHKPVTINFSPTLWVSGTGLILILVGTAVIVPFNRFFIDRRWAICLLVGYAVIMTTNVVVEVRSERRS